MTAISFPNETTEYRSARDRLLAEEIELRRAMEAVAAARRALPAGGLVPEDYVFHGLGPEGVPSEIKLSELFAPGKDSLVVYNFMFPRHPSDRRAGPTTDQRHVSRWRTARVPPAPLFWTSSKALRSTWRSGSTS